MSSTDVCEVEANQEYVDSQSDKKVLMSSNNILFFHLFLINMSFMLNLFLRRYLKWCNKIWKTSYRIISHTEKEQECRNAN